MAQRTDDRPIVDSVLIRRELLLNEERKEEISYAKTYVVTTIRHSYHLDTMRASSLAIVAGVGLFVLPIPGTFVTGALVAGAGALARYLGH